MASRAAARSANLETEGTRAALTEQAAKPAPRTTSAHEPEETTAAVIRTNVAVTEPKTAMATRAAMPKGWVAHALSARFKVVIASGVSAGPTIVLIGPKDPFRACSIGAASPFGPAPTTAASKSVTTRLWPLRPEERVL